MHLTRGDLPHKRELRLTYSATGGRRVSISLGMDGAVLPEEWIACLQDAGRTLDRLAMRRRLTEPQVRAITALRLLRLGGHRGDVPVYHGRLHPKLHYIYGVRCARLVCPCVLERSRDAICPREYRFDGDPMDRDGFAPRILVVDPDWNGPGAVQGFLENTALWHQRVQSWHGAVWTLALAIFGADTEDAATEAEKLAGRVFDSFQRSPLVPSNVWFAATDFWRFCVQRTIEECLEETDDHDEITRLNVDHVVERMQYLQERLTERRAKLEHQFKNPLEVTIQSPEAEIAKGELQNHVIRLLQANACDRSAGSSRGKRSRR